MRLLLVLAVIAFFLLCAGAMFLGYRNRAKRQAALLPAFPQVPDPSERGAELLSGAKGIYVSTVTDASWQDRIAIGDIGFRAAATLRLFAEGIFIDRTGASPLWIPMVALCEARRGQGLAGKVMLGDDLLIVRWQWEGQVFDTGFLPDDRAIYQEWLTTVNSLAERALMAKGSEQ